MDRQIESILVPTDGSDGARVGSRRAVDLAARVDADFHVLSVVETRETSGVTVDQGDDAGADRDEQLHAAAREAVDREADLARAHLSGDVSTAVEDGVPHEAITEYARRHDVDLIVMGTHGRSGVERLLLGSVGEKTLRTATVPVVLVPPAADLVEIGEGSYDRILVPTDGSEEAADAVEWGISLATALDGTIHGLYAVDTSYFTGVADTGAIYDALERTGRDALETVRSRARAADVDVVGNLATGPAARAILDYAAEHEVDAIAMGTHGRSGVERYLIGSVTETVVRRADVPVCCVPPADGD